MAFLGIDLRQGGSNAGAWDPVGDIKNAANVAFPGPAKPNPPPPPDARLAQIRDQRIKEATDYRSNLPGTINDASSNLQNVSRRQLAGDIASNKMSANRRGLLGSGLNQAADAQASGKASVNYAQANQGMVNQLQNQADLMETSAINNGYDYWQSAKGAQDSAYNAALSNMMAARSGTTALIGAGTKGAALAV